MTGPGNRTQVELEFPGTTRADEALQTFQQLETAQVLRLVNAAVIKRDEAGDLTIREIGDLSLQAKWVLIGAASLTGFLAGLLWRGLRTGLLAGYAVGQAGALLATLFD